MNFTRFEIHWVPKDRAGNENKGLEGIVKLFEGDHPSCMKGQECSIKIRVDKDTTTLESEWGTMPAIFRGELRQLVIHSAQAYYAGMFGKPIITGWKVEDH